MLQRFYAVAFIRN